MKFLFTLFALVLAGTVVATSSMAAESASKKTKQDLSQYPNSGTVQSVIDTDMYTYVEVAGKTDKDESIWLAVSKMKVAKGDAIRFGGGAVMTNFHSKSLNRTFASITFSDKVVVVK